MRTCFVMSPIGEDGSAARKLADDLLDLVIEPALEPYKFRVVRADKIVSSGTITSEIIELVQSAELCIIDLTGHNANVFYECGRRHENAKPFIQLIRKGEKLPFDVAGIRTIHYDLTDPRAVHETKLEVRRYVEAVTQSAAISSSTGVSVATLGEAVDRIERKVDKIMSQQRSNVEQPLQGGSAGPIASFGKRPVNPHRGFLSALAKGDTAVAATFVSQMYEKFGLKPFVLSAATIVAARGGEVVGATILFEFLDHAKANTITEGEASYSRCDALVGLANYYSTRQEFAEGIARLHSPSKQRLTIVTMSRRTEVVALMRFKSWHSGMMMLN